MHTDHTGVTLKPKHFCWNLCDQLDPVIIRASLHLQYWGYKATLCFAFQVLNVSMF